MKRVFPLLIISVVLISLLASEVKQASAKHQPLLPGSCGQTVDICPTPHIRKAIERKVVTYRLDQGTLAYPGFRQQAADVAAAWFATVGVEGREITEGTPDLYLTFPSDSAFLSVCGDGAAGCIQYWGDPVMVFFRRALLYGDWKTAISHEGINGGHALGEGEQYYDNGEFRCDPAATYTVMSCSTGVWQPQPFDKDLVCRILKTSWCGNPPPPPSEYGECQSNGIHTWCWHNYDLDWHMVVFAKRDDGSEYDQQWRSTGGPWTCVDRCP